MIAQRHFSGAIHTPTSTFNKKFGPRISLALALGILVFLVGVSGSLPSAVVHAAPLLPCSSTIGPPCLLGPNLEVNSITGPLTTGTGPCVGGTPTYNADPINPGFGETGIPTPCSGFGSTQGETISLTALNGFAIDDLSGSVTCGVTGSDSLIFSANSISLTCPTETTVGATGTISGSLTFSPVTNLNVNVTVANTFATGGSSSSSAASNSFSLVSTPEPSSLLLLSSGLVGLGFLKRKLYRN